MIDPSDLASSDHRLLSDEYRRLNRELHEREPMYGTTGRRYVDVIRSLAREYEARHILDYGCGKRDLWTALHEKLDVRNFDPALPGLDAPPEPADLVACIDVLEHVEPGYLDSVLADLARVTIRAAFFTIATRPAGKHLADGTNCHRIVQGADWWLSRLLQCFHLDRHYTTDQNGLQVVLEPTRGVSSPG